jgi:N-acetyltransferase
MGWPEPVTLAGKDVVLAPLSHEHAAGMREAVADGELWKLWYTRIVPPEGIEEDIERRLRLQRAGSMLPFAVLERNTGRALGMTTYMNIDVPNRRVEIGSTWYRKSAQRTSFNTQCKRALLAHAFEQLGCMAVDFRTSFMNTQSRRAIERLGAKLDGILRNHQIVDAQTLRDTCVYSIVAHEWPAVKMHLDWQLEKPRESAEAK